MTARENFLLERYRLNELPEKQREEVEAMDHFPEWMKELDHSDQEIDERFHYSNLEKKIQRRQIRFRYRMASLAAVLVLVIGTGFLLMNPFNISEESQLYRVKGQQSLQPGLTLYRHSGNSVEPMMDGDPAEPGDLIQIGYKGISQGTYGLILSLDGAGNQTIHFPMSGEDAQIMETESEYFLPWSYELDGAPDFEAFFLILSEKAFSMKDISAAALLDNRIPRGVEVYGFMVTK